MHRCWGSQVRGLGAAGRWQAFVSPVCVRFVVALTMDSFDIMGHSILKLYKGIVNVILRISPLDADPVDAAPNALLLNSHVDSTLPSPGAAERVFESATRSRLTLSQ